MVKNFVEHSGFVVLKLVFGFNEHDRHLLHILFYFNQNVNGNEELAEK